jgi:hypothetical protein
MYPTPTIASAPFSGISGMQPFTVYLQRRHQVDAKTPSKRFLRYRHPQTSLRARMCQNSSIWQKKLPCIGARDVADSN